MEMEIVLIYGALLFSVISLWSKFKLLDSIPLWLISLTVFFVLALIYKRASLFSLVYTVVFGSTIYFFYQKNNLYLFFLVIALSVPLYFHFSILEFDNFKYLNNITLTSNSTPYSLYFNLDKTLIGIFIIGFSFRCSKIDFLSFSKLFFINLLFMICIFTVLPTIIGYSKFEMKLPYFTPVWILVNLFSTCVAEEALFRRFIQHNINSSLKGKIAVFASILIASILFGLSHYKGGIVYIALASLAGVFYGYIYHKTKRIESSILLHFIFNLIHFLFFSYPALK